MDGGGTHRKMSQVKVQIVNLIKQKHVTGRETNGIGTDRIVIEDMGKDKDHWKENGREHESVINGKYIL